MVLERRSVEAALERKGFEPAQGDHHFFVYWTIAGTKTSVWTKTSHGSGYKTLSDDLVGKMAKQCGISTGQFKTFVDCKLSREEYEKALVNNSRIRP